jgi:cell division septation protein DedD
MADESKTRPYRSDAYATRNASTQGGGRTSGGDPLAELARLIGQDDLFEQSRSGASRPLARSNPRYSEPTTPTADPTPRHTDTGATSSSWRASQSIEDELRGTYSGREDARATRRTSADYGDEQDYASTRPQNVRAARHAQRQYEDYDQASYAQPAAAAPAARDSQSAAYARQQQYVEPQPTTADPDYAQDVVADPYANEQYEQAGHYGEDAYDQPPVKERRRGGLITVAAIICVALIGTAAAFGYRSWSGSSHGQPPVINAQGGPNKITPPQNAGDQANKAIYDRADKTQGERVVSREEQPMDVKQNTASTSAENNGNTAGGTSEPRKVRTFAIRPDGSIITDASGAPVPSGARVAAAAPAPQEPPPTPRAAPTRAAPAPAAQPTRTVALPPSQQAVPAGSYVVQLVSNKSEAEAQSAFRGLQAKYPSVLGNRQPLIRRVDLGDKGIYYRAQVGPFAAADEANDFCGNLKSAGGQCIVQKN